MGDTITLRCPIDCDELDAGMTGEVIWVYPGRYAFEVRFPGGGRVSTVTRAEILDDG